MQKALIVIDIQNDYFPEGKFPLWNTEAVLEANIRAVALAHENNIPIFLVQHLADAQGPFFVPDSHGAAIHPQILAEADGAPVIVKHQADSFYQTDLLQQLQELGTEEIWLTGMMTHNCVTHTALSLQAQRFQVKVASDATTTVSEIIHKLALHALSARLDIRPSFDP